MSRTFTRFADALLDRVVPHLQTKAQSVCVVGRTIWQTCYCQRGLRIGKPCYYFQNGSNLMCGCFACQEVIGTC